jgi:FkbM family methyltransferase
MDEAVDRTRAFFTKAGRLTPLVAVRTATGTFIVRTGAGSAERALFTRRERPDMQVIGQASRVLKALKGASAVTGSTLLDVGASIGTCAVPALLLHGFARAVAFEPRPDDFVMLRLNALANDLDERLTAIEAAVGDRAGTLTLPSRSTPDEPAEESGLEVAEVALDEVAAEGVFEPNRAGLLRVADTAPLGRVLAGAGALTSIGVPLLIAWDPDALGPPRNAARIRAVLSKQYSHFVDLGDDAEGEAPAPSLHRTADLENGAAGVRSAKQTAGCAMLLLRLRDGDVPDFDLRGAMAAEPTEADVGPSDEPETSTGPAKAAAKATRARAKHKTRKARRKQRAEPKPEVTERDRRKASQRVVNRARSRATKQKGRAPKRPEMPPERYAEFLQLCRDRQVTIDKPLTMISQAPRSGGTLLRNLLDGHPELHVHPYELHVGYPNKNAWPTLPLDRPPEIWWSRLREDSLERLSHTGVRQNRTKVRGSDVPTRKKIYPLELIPAVQRQLFLDAIASCEHVTGDREILDAYLSSLFGAWINNRNLSGDKRWTVAFAPRLAWGAGLDAFFSAYPDGRLISILRDPWSWYASANARQPDMPPEGQRLIALWQQSARETMRARQEYGDLVRVVRFDDLLRSTKPTMQSLAEFLGVDWRPSLLKPTFNGWPMGANSSHSYSTSGLITDPLTRYRSLLSEDELAAISEGCGELYEQASTVATPVAA